MQNNFWKQYQHTLEKNREKSYLNTSQNLWIYKREYIRPYIQNAEV